MSDFRISPDSRTTRLTEAYPFVRELCQRVHGSGVNYEWTVDKTPTTFKLHNSWDVMDPISCMERGAVPFTVIIPICDVDDFKIVANTKDRYWWNRLEISEYLYDLISSTIIDITGMEIGCKQTFRIVEGHDAKV